MSMMIDAKEISKFYGPFVAVQDISFQIPSRQVVAMLGPNGAGKSTLMKILTGYLAPSGGTAAIAGHDVQRDRLAAAAHVGYLPENGPLYSDMTALELLRFFGEARGLSRGRLKDRVEAVAEQCSIRDILEKPVGKLSKGLRQRVGLSVALLHDPDVLIVDEPTAGLDPNQVRHFREQIAELQKDEDDADLDAHPFRGDGRCRSRNPHQQRPSDLRRQTGRLDRRRHRRRIRSTAGRGMAAAQPIPA